MATYSFTSLSTLSSSPLPKPKPIPTNSSNPYFLSHCPQNPTTTRKILIVSALVEGDKKQYSSGPAFGNGFSLQEDSEFRNSFKPYELYVCNLPIEFGIPELLNTFNPFGTVQSVEVNNNLPLSDPIAFLEPDIPVLIVYMPSNLTVSRNAETGISRGCGYVTMSSLDEAKAAIAALDGSDVDGREMRVSFSVDVNSKQANTVSRTRPQKNLVFESPYKMYVGNLAWSVKPEDLRNHFSRFGAVVSTTVLHDRKGGKNRVYGFLSFASSEELEAAMSLDGTEFYGRPMKIREVVKWPEPEP